MAKQVYKIVFGSKDSRSANSTLAKKQKAILVALVAGAGQLTAAQIAERATTSIGDEETKVSDSEVSRFVKEMKLQRPAQAKQLPSIKGGTRGGKAMVSASDEEFDSALAAILKPKK